MSDCGAYCHSTLNAIIVALRFMFTKRRNRYDVQMAQHKSQAMGVLWLPCSTNGQRGAMNQTERFYKIDQMLNDRKVVSFQTMMDELEVSRATLKRDLAYLRDRLNAPIIYDRDVGG